MANSFIFQGSLHPGLYWESSRRQNDLEFAAYYTCLLPTTTAHFDRIGSVTRAQKPFSWFDHVVLNTDLTFKATTSFTRILKDDKKRGGDLIYMDNIWDLLEPKMEMELKNKVSPDLLLVFWLASFCAAPSHASRTVQWVLLVTASAPSPYLVMTHLVLSSCLIHLLWV